MTDAGTLAQAETWLEKHSPDQFETTIDAWPECIEAVRVVEDEEAWKAGYVSVDAFYAAHERRHPDVRLYGEARREILTADLWSPGGTATQVLDRLRHKKRLGESAE